MASDDIYGELGFETDEFDLASAETATPSREPAIANASDSGNPADRQILGAALATSSGYSASVAAPPQIQAAAQAAETVVVPDAALEIAPFVFPSGSTACPLSRPTPLPNLRPPDRS